MSDTTNSGMETDADKRARLTKDLKKLEESNRATMDQLQKRGHAPNALDVTRLRAEVLISAILGANTDARLQYETMWQTTLREYLAEAFDKGNEKKLHVPGRR